MKTILLMRHAKSDWKKAGLSDHDRPLNARGRRAAPAMAEHLLGQSLAVDVFLVSTAVRVSETVELMQQRWCPAAEVLRCPSLYLASPQTILAEIRGLHDSWSHVMVVAHNPGLVALASGLADQDLEMPTAAVAVFQSSIASWTTPLSADNCQLTAYWKPRELMAD